MEKLALFGGDPVLKEVLPRSNNISKEEKQAVMRVLESGILSDYVGRAGEFFLGGKEVKNFEKMMCEAFNISQAVSFNSATTALESAVAALCLEPGSEVIVPPYTMSASVTSIIVNNLAPVFADIDEKSFCLDVKSVEKNITNKTKAIMVVNLFGGCPDYDGLLALAKKYDLKIIEDNAQDVVEVVGNAAGQLAHRLHLLGAAQQGFLLQEQAFRASDLDDDEDGNQRDRKQDGGDQAGGEGASGIDGRAGGVVPLSAQREGADPNALRHALSAQQGK